MQPNIPDFFAAQQDYIAQMNNMLGVLRASQPLVGEIRALAHLALPAGWLACDGAEVSREQHAALFAAIGTAYGDGDGVTTFALPNLLGRVMRGAAPGDTGGADSVTLAVEQLPSHAHGVEDAGIDIAPGNVGVDPAPSVDPYYLTGVTTAASGPVTTVAPGENKSTLRGVNVVIAETGGGAAIDITPAYTGVLYCIYAGA